MHCTLSVCLSVSLSTCKSSSSHKLLCVRHACKFDTFLVHAEHHHGALLLYVGYIHPQRHGPVGLQITSRPVDQPVDLPVISCDRAR